jgi:hypothetical protein
MRATRPGELWVSPATSGKGAVTPTSANGTELKRYRQVRDIADVPAIAPLNSISSQELATTADYASRNGSNVSASGQESGPG